MISLAELKRRILHRNLPGVLMAGTNTINNSEPKVEPPSDTPLVTKRWFSQSDPQMVPNSDQPAESGHWPLQNSKQKYVYSGDIWDDLAK